MAADGGTLTQVGVAGILAIMILREVFGFVGKIRNGKPGVAPVCSEAVLSTLTTMAERLKGVDHLTRDLHTWHNRQDEDGVPIWYVRKSLEDAVHKLADNIERQSDIMERQAKVLEDHRKSEAQQTATLTQIHNELKKSNGN